MPHQTWVARFVVDHGQVTEEGGVLRTFPRRRLDEPEADLHLLAEATGPKAEELGAQAVEAIGRDFLKDNLSLTGGLQRALRSTNQVLLDWNRRSIAREQVAVGVTAAVVRGSIVYLSQVGQTLVYLIRQGSLSRLEPNEMAAVPLGEGPVEPEVRRLELEPGDAVIAANQTLGSLMDAASLEALLLRGTDVALPEIYLLTRGMASFALFAVTCLDGPAEPEPDSAAGDADEPLKLRRQPDEGGPPEPVLTFEPPPEDQGLSSAIPALVMPKPIDISRPVVRLRSDQFSSRGEYPRTTGPARRFQMNLPGPSFIGILAAVGLAVFIAAFTVPDLIQENRQEQASTLVQKALSAFTTAGQEADKGRQRSLYEETRRLTSEALRIEPANISATELHQQVTAKLVELDAVFNLEQVQTVTTLGRQVTGEIGVKDMVVAAGNAYLLDSKGGRVIQVPLTAGAAPSVAFDGGETYAGTMARDPQFLAWDAQSNRLLVLDGERRLFEVRPGFVQPLTLRRTSSWASVAGFAAYSGNLYVLDPAGRQIHRYLPAASGFDSEPSPVLGSQANIGSAVSFGVETDVFVLMEKGELLRFRNGVAATLPLAGIDKPLAAPTKVVALPNGGELYMADSGNKRVVVANRDGVFQRQLVSTSFTDLSAVAVDPATGTLYVVVGDALLSAPIVR
jgi:hypothetical protein